MSERFRAVVARAQDEVATEELSAADLPRGEVLVEVSHSSLNYKDGLAVTGKGRIARSFPMVLGIDLAGTVVESATPEFQAGDRVLGTGQGLGESSWGGYSRLQWVSAEAILPVPPSLTNEEAMAFGTAGLTAMLALMALERSGSIPGEREMIVTGAGGGVGSIAVQLLAASGFRVAAATGRPEVGDFLRRLGATSIVGRDALTASRGPMQAERWAGGIDTVGGAMLAGLYAQTAYGGAIAVCGMAGGHELAVTVWPMILRNVSLLGVSSLRPSKSVRTDAWNRLARDFDRELLPSLHRTEPMSKIFDLAGEILAGAVRGRVVVDVNA